MPQTLHARYALTADGWKKDLFVTIGDDGRISALDTGAAEKAQKVGVLLPGMANLHSHSFQRAFAGLTEARGPDTSDDFWSWRVLMYRFLEVLTPEDVEVIAAQVQLEMLEAGYTSVGEFHYLHHQPGGASYENPAELSSRIINAAMSSGIGLTHLPVLYMRGGLDERSLDGSQLRFGCDESRFADLYAAIEKEMNALPPDARLGIAPHSLRAVSEQGLGYAEKLASNGPIHIHIAEQTAEIDAVTEAYGSPPIRWLMDHANINSRWCLIHATHMQEDEITSLAKSGAVAGLCPITEGNLGDGIFEAQAFINQRGQFGIGSDSNVRISISEELRLLEYSQRFHHRGRALLADINRSSGRFIYEEAAIGGAKALGRGSGQIESGALADLIALDDAHLHLAGLEGDQLLDAFVFAGDDRLVTNVWSAGRQMVRAGQHVARDKITPPFTELMTRLRGQL